jgi:zinc protease
MAADEKRFIGQPGLPPWRGVYDFTLENGLRVVFAQRAKSPVVELRLVIDGGFAADPEGRSGLSALSAALFREGLVRFDGAQLDAALDVFGTTLTGQVMPDAAVIGFSALNASFGDALETYVTALKNREFENEDFELLQASQLAVIASERLDPFELALRVLPPLIYGRGHMYARPFSGLGNDRDVAAITPDDLCSYYGIHLTADSNTLLIAGSCETADLRTKLEGTFGRWRAGPAALPTSMIEMFPSFPPGVIVDRPGASQTVLAAGLRTVAANSTHAAALMVASTILAGIFTSRLNLSLREHKGWTYGVRSSLIDAREQGLWLIRTAVRTDCAAQAMAEIAGEIENLAGRRPATADEFSRAVGYLVARMPSNYETCAQMADALAHATIHRLPTSYPQSLTTRLQRLTLTDVKDACHHVLAAGGVRWMVVGDAAALNYQLGRASFPTIQIIE